MAKRAALSWGVVVGLAFFGLAPSAPAMNDWTIAVYSVLDDNDSSTLEDSGIRDLNELASVGSQGSIELVAQSDRSKAPSDLQRRTYQDPAYRGAVRYLFKKDQWIEEERPGEANMGSPYDFWDFLKWVATKHPARHYFLVVAGHGSGVFSWRGTGSTSSGAPGAVEFDPDRFVAYDDTDNDCLTVFEMAAVLKAFRERLNGGRKLDVVAFDACLTGMVEALYQLREGADVMVGSASTIPMSGLDYDSIARRAIQEPQIPAERLAEVAVRSFVAAASSSGEGNVLAAWRTAGAEDLVSALGNLSLELSRALEHVWFWQSCKIFKVPSYGGNARYYDLGRMCRSVVDGSADLKTPDNDQAIRDNARDVLKALEACTVAREASGRWRAEEVAGLSLAAPSKKGEYDSYRAFYKALDFARDTTWDEILDKGRLHLEP